MKTLEKLGDVVELAGVDTVDLMYKGIDNIGDKGVARLAAALEINTSVTDIYLGCE